MTIIIGILASIVAPFVQAARERALDATVRSDMRNMMAAIETYQTIEMGMPSSAQQMVDGDYFTSTPDVEVCYFISIPGFSWRPPSVLLIMAHAGSTTMMYTIHPIDNGQVREFSTSAPGCAF